MGYTIVLRPAPGTPEDWASCDVGFGRWIHCHRRLPAVRFPVRPPPEQLYTHPDPPPLLVLELHAVTAHATGLFEYERDGSRAEVYEIGPPAGEREPSELLEIRGGAEPADWDLNGAAVREIFSKGLADLARRRGGRLERPVAFTVAEDGPLPALNIRAVAPMRLPSTSTEAAGQPWFSLRSLEGLSLTVTGTVNQEALEVLDRAFGDLGAVTSPPGAEPGLDASAFDPRPFACWSCNDLPGLDALDGLCDRCHPRLTATQEG